MVSVTLDVCHRGGWKVQLGHEGLKQANTPIVVGRDRSPRGLYVPGDPGHRAGVLAQSLPWLETRPPACFKSEHSEYPE
jgi:hypothetical protein